MHGLPDDFDAVVFVGTSLESVSFTVNTVHLSFGDEISVTILTSFLYRPAAADGAQTQDLPPGITSLPALVGGTVTAATAHSDGTLRLDLGDGGHIELTDDSTSYESYSIHIGDRSIYVCQECQRPRRPAVV